MTQQRMLRKVSYLLSRSGLQVWLFWVPTHLMPGDHISRYIVMWGGCLGRGESVGGEVVESLRESSEELVSYGRVNALWSPEERRAKRERDREMHAKETMKVPSWVW